MNNRPAIAIVVPGGIGIHDNIPVLVTLLRNLAASFDVTIYSFSNLETHPSLITSSKCMVVYAPSKIKSNVLKALYFIWKIRHDQAFKQFVVIQGFWIMLSGIVAVVSGKLLNIPSVVTLPGGDITYIPTIHYGSISNPLKRMLTAWCVHHASRVVTLTRFQQTIMKQHGISRDGVSIIPYGVDLTRFQFHPHAFTKPLQLIYIGNLNRVKDSLTLIKVFYSLSQRQECRLTIVGSDIMNGEVQAYAHELGVYEKIRWEGKLGYDKIPAELFSADILLITSLYEGQAAVVLEAFASGAIVVGTKVGLLADIGDNTITVSPGDADGLTMKIEELIHHPETVSTLQSTNRKYAETYSAEWTFNEYTKVYNELIIPRQH
jgi:glycosyltransferase involved in cell wall biosynthesis